MRCAGTWLTIALGLCVALSARGADESAIRKAVERGVAYLKSQQQSSSGTWDYPGSSPGATALAGLTLLECDTPSDDPAVRRAAEALRVACPRLTHTYSLSLAILFFDRLGDPADVRLIESMAVRLLAGQNASGGWTYDCPSPPAEEVRQLTTPGRDRSERRHAAPSNENSGRPMLPREISQLLQRVNPLLQGDQLTDNSNTKFATLALWVARRHGIPVGTALGLVESRFRQGQNPDGGWSYFPPMPGGRHRAESLASMTCAGLLGLALSHGAANEGILVRGPRATGTSHPRPVLEDRAIDAGLRLLATVIDQPLPAPPRALRLYGGKEGDEFYSLWALERVAVAYGLDSIGGKDWYAWGAQYLVDHQRDDGAWIGRYPEAGVDTCFALLFLRRANLAKDLTASLSRQGSQHRPLPGAPAGVRNPARNPQPVTRSRSPVTAPHTPAAAPETSEEFERRVAELTGGLVQAAPTGQGEVIKRYQDQKGSAYTQALAAAIPRLTGATQHQAREALAARLARMTPETLRARLRDEDPEVRRAAAVACATKDSQALVPDLINALQDSQSEVWQAAASSLRTLTGRDLGPAADATSADREAAQNAWRTWWAGRK